MKQVELYFKNENDAQSAKSELNKFKVKNVAIEKMEEGSRNGLFIPIFSPYWGAGGGVAGGSIPSYNEDSKGSSEVEQSKNADPKYMSQLLRFEVSEEDYDEVLSVLKEYDPHGIEENKG